MVCIAQLSDTWIEIVAHFNQQWVHFQIGFALLTEKWLLFVWTLQHQTILLLTSSFSAGSTEVLERSALRADRAHLSSV